MSAEERYRKALEEIAQLSSIDQAADGSGPMIVMRDEEMRAIANAALLRANPHYRAR